MKRLSFLVLIGILVFGSVFAQDKDARPDRNNRQDRKENRELNKTRRELKSVTIEGTLKLEKGLIAIASGENTYYVPTLARFVGFIDGLKEGAKVSVTGFEARNFIFPTKANIAGKNYDLVAEGRGPVFGNNFGPGPKRGDFNRNRNFGPSHRNAPRRGVSRCG